MLARPSLIIRSIDRVQGDPSEFIVQVPFSAQLQGDYQLAEVAIPNQIYNIDDSNSILKYFDTQWRTIKLPNGYYTTSGLLAAVESAMVAASGVAYVISMNSTTLLTTITIAAGTFYIDLSDSSPLALVLGFEKNPSQVTSTAASLTTTLSTIPNRGIEYLLVVVSEMSTGSFLQTNNQSATFKVPILAANGQNSYLTQELLFNQTASARGQMIKTMNVRVLRPNGSKAHLKADWFFTLTQI